MDPESLGDLVARLDESGTETASLYGTLAPLYEYAMQHVGAPEKQRSLVTETIPDEADSLVEYACGYGGLLALLADRFDDVLGIDRSERQLARARAKTDAPLVRADVRHGVLDAEFDAAVMLGNTLGHLTADGDVERCFASVADALAPGGHFHFDCHALAAYSTPQADEHVGDGDRFHVVHEGELSAADERGIVERTDAFTVTDRRADRTVTVETPPYEFRARERDDVTEALAEAGFDVAAVRRLAESYHVLAVRR